MNRTVSATNARIRFGEIMRQAKIGPVIVERDGTPEVVFISKQEYDRLVEAAPKPDWWKKLAETQELIREELQGRELPDPAGMLRLAWEEREEELLNSLH
jgi:prevent-host-death family protein